MSTGKNWHTNKSAFRPNAGQSTFQKRLAERQAQAAMKAKEKEMKDEKEDERQVRCQLYTSEAWALLIYGIGRGAYSESKIGEQLRKKRKGMRRWQRKCIENEWRD